MNGPLLLGIEIGGTKLQLGLGRGDGRLLALERLEIIPQRGAGAILDQIAGAIEPLLDRAGAADRSIDAVGIGFGGPVDAEKGIVTKSFHVSNWEDFALVDWVRTRLGVSTVSLHNDADTAALAEARFGAAVGLSPVLYVTIGSRIGGGLVVNGQIYRGSGTGALEIGHVNVWNPPFLKDQERTEFEELEEIAAGWSIESDAAIEVERRVSANEPPGLLLELAGGNPERITTKHVAEAARAGDPLADALLGRAAMAMAHGLAAAVGLLAPRRIVLGGGVSLIGEDLWFKPIREELDILVFEPFRGTFDVVPAALGEEVVVHGALALAQDALFSTVNGTRRS